MSNHLFERNKKKVFSDRMFLCPYCFRILRKENIHYICADCRRTVVPRLSKPYKCSFPGCGGLAIVRKCMCGESIPLYAFETPNLQFSIVGMSNSGKTNYITVMLNELSRITSLPLALGCQTLETWTHHDKNVNYIYEQHIVPSATAAGEAMPQIWYLKNLLKKSGDIVPTYTFTVYDGAGEDHENNMDVNSPVCGYIKNSKALIVVIDPLVIPGVISSCGLDSQMVKNSLNGDSNAKNISNVLIDLILYIKTARGISANEMIDIPVAVVLTKFDTIMHTDYFSVSSPLKSSSVAVCSDGTVNLSEIKQVNDEIQNWFIEIGESGFINNLKSNFENMMLFGVSSYGAPPDTSGRLPESIRPHRVLDPMLWLFKVNGFVD